jgi:hypothetical protein
MVISRGKSIQQFTLDEDHIANSFGGASAGVDENVVLHHP